MDALSKTTNETVQFLVNDVIFKCPPDRAALERALRSLPDSASEAEARRVIEELEVPVEGASYVEVRRS
jgi:hypothetical protein